MVEADFMTVWTNLVTRGIREDDAFLIVKGRIAHQAANDAVRALLSTDCDSAFFIDSDCDIGPSYLEELRTLEDGFDYDIFQGFYTRRGWPPEAIWFKETSLGDLMQCIVWKDDHTEETAMAGLHNTLIRREVFEKMMEAEPDVSLQDFNWFFYPRHGWRSEDSSFCFEARKQGFKVASTTKLKAGHITRVTTGWQTYQEFLQASGAAEQWQTYYSLVEMVSDFTGEDYDMVIAKSIQGWENTRPAYEKYDPKNAQEHREFFGYVDNGYLYDLLAWNVSPTYKKIIKPLDQVKGKKVLIVGAGLGGEVEVLSGNNQVDIFEIPGVLRDFLKHRFPHGYFISADTLQKLSRTYFQYDLIVAVDVVEHFHTDEFEETLDAMLKLLKPDGAFYMHNNFREHEKMPQAFDHKARFDAWCEANKIEQPDAPFGFYGRKVTRGETVSVE
jgi:SAM-dependent methyltransferase